MGATGGRESMFSKLQRLVKFVPFIMHLNEFPLDNAMYNKHGLAMYNKHQRKYYSLLPKGLVKIIFQNLENYVIIIIIRVNSTNIF